jgi:leucyl aminopeptidase
VLVRSESLAEAVPIWFVTKETWPKIRDSFPQPAQSFADACGFEPKPGRSQILPGSDGEIAGVLFGIESVETRTRDFLLPGQLATSLPPGLYRFANSPHDASLAALSWLLSAYRFHRYKPGGGDHPCSGWGNVNTPYQQASVPARPFTLPLATTNRT